MAFLVFDRICNNLINDNQLAKITYSLFRHFAVLLTYLNAQRTEYLINLYFIIILKQISVFLFLLPLLKDRLWRKNRKINPSSLCIGK